MSKVFLGVGHGGIDTGAVGFLVEKDVNLNMAFACKEYLEAKGVEVKMSRYKDENDTLNEEVQECNAFNPDLAVDIHNNAGGGDGFEVYYTIKGGLGKILAENIEKEVIAIGQNSRGIKTKEGNNGDYYGFIRMTKCPAVICEGVFVDNETDAKGANTLDKQKSFGVAYAKGILKTLGIEDNVDNKPENPIPETKPEVPSEDIFNDGKINCIYDIQEWLNKEYNTALVLDNKYGPKTKSALIKGLQTELNKQFNKNLNVDGIWGPKTYEACINVKEGAIKNIKMLIQMALFIKGYNVSMDKKFGPDTTKKVKEFQKANNLKEDGIVGKDTFKKLFE